MTLRRSLFWISALATLVSPLPDPFLDAKVDKGTFDNPSAHVRPKFRYWIPDASVDIDVVAQDVKAAKDAGCGGLELLGYYLYGGPPSNGAGRGTYAPVDWSIYGFGGDAWHEVFRAFAQAHKDEGLFMDFAMGPNQGTGVPAPLDTEGLSWDISAFNVTVSMGEVFDDVLPGWGTGVLQAAVAATVAETRTLTSSDPSGGLPGDLPMSRTQHTLAGSSLTDVTDQIDSSGNLHFDFSIEPAFSNATGDSHVIFAIYLAQSRFRAQQGPLEMGGPQTAPASWRQNGSWAVDHFSAVGARVTTQFWEDYILNNGTRELLQQVGNYGWEDSVEIEANVYWTKNLSSIFEQQNGYSINKYLPILFHRNGKYKNSNPATWWITDEEDGGNSHIADYRATLATQYRVYEETLNSWAEDYLGLQFSAQLSYNLPMDMLANIPTVDAPETESLDFSDLIDGYRQYSGPANLAQRRIVSSECGAVRGEAYVETLPEILWKVKRSYAGSLNQFVFHGFPYSGEYGNTTWPTWSTFNYQYSDMHGPHLPAWEYYREQFDFIARNNWVFQSGVPKMDLAIWQKISTYPGHIQSRTYAPTDLEEQGYSYQYLSPDNFELPSANVVDGVLAPDAQAFKALLVRANDSLTLDGVRKLVEFADDGLPIVFAGGKPSSVLGTASTADLQEVETNLTTISQLDNVHTTDSYLVASVITSLGIEPLTRITPNPNASWHTYWRSDPSTNIDYVFVYNDAMYAPQGAGVSEATIEFQSTKVPYEYNAWTGEQRPILAYNTTNTSTIIPMRLAGNQSTIVAFMPPSENITTSSIHVTGSSPAVYDYALSANGTVIVKATQSGSVSTSSGATKTITAPPASSFALSDWTLVVEHWDPPADLYNYTSGAVKHNTTHELPSLVTWDEISGLQNVSGRGFYSTTFTWPPHSKNSTLNSSATSFSSLGAFIDFGYTYHTLQASINGHAVPPLDVTRPRADITPYLRNGENNVEAVVSTPLGNVMIPIWSQLVSSGEGPASSDAGPSNGFVPPPRGKYGLGMAVVIVPYVEVDIG